MNIEKVVFGGEGLGHVDGKVVLIEGVLEGETVQAEIIQDLKNYSRAKVVKIIKASAERVKPPCPYLTHCGGCQYQHMSYAEELRVKDRQVREALKGALNLPDSVFSPIVPSAREYRYRNSITLHPAAHDGKKPVRLGFIGRDNHSMVIMEDCLLADERFRALFTQKFIVPANATRITFKLAEDGRIYSDDKDHSIRIALGRERFILSSKGFFQNNLPVADALGRLLASWVDEAQPSMFLDLYAGVGTFSFLAAKGVGRILAVEENPSNIEALRMNASERGLKSMEILEGRVQDCLPKLCDQDRIASDAFVFVDPPREGMTRPLTAMIGERVRAKTLAYVSCDLARLTRDLITITKNGRYAVRRVAAFDMFPKTRHIETAVLLTGGSA